MHGMSRAERAAKVRELAGTFRAVAAAGVLLRGRLDAEVRAA